MTRQRWTVLLGLALFVGALWLLHAAVRDVHYGDVVAALRALPRSRLLLALAFTASGYLALTAYDTLGCRYVRHPLPYRQTALAAFIGYAFSQTLGLPLLSGGAVRVRLYSAWGLSTSEIAGIIGFAGVTFWVGFCVLGGSVLTLAPPPTPTTLHLPFATVRPLGLCLLGLAAVYVGTVTVRRKPLRWRDWEIDPPPRWMVLPQIVVASLDWTFAGAALWALLPSSAAVSPTAFFGAFLLAQLLGLLSNVPGGLGVFESIIVILLSSRVDTEQILGALLAFRAIYYLAPLAAATLLLGVLELRRRPALARATQLIDELASVVPHVLAFASFVSGAVLLFSGATPGLSHRLAWLERLLPLSLVETSHFVGSVVGAALLLLARDLQRRLDSAYLATVALLTVGIVASLLKGLDYEEAFILAIVLFAVLPARRQFYRPGALVALRFTPAWVASIAIVAVASLWLLFFAHRHVAYAGELWWQFEFHASAPRAMRATAGAMLLLLFGAARLLFRPVVAEPDLPIAPDLARAEAILVSEPTTFGNLALLGDKRLLFAASGRAFLMYGVEGRSWVALGDPIGAPGDREELAWRFRELTDRHDGRTVFYHVGTANLPLYLDLGLTLTKLGEEARIPLEAFSLAGSQRKSLRQTVRRLSDEGWTFRVAPLEEVAARMDELRAVSDAWLREKNTREKGFSLGFFAPAYLQRFPAALVERQGVVAAFANLWRGASHEEVSIDLMRHLPDAPNGIMDFLFANLFLWGRAEGYRTFNLGMVPLSGLPDHALAPLWNRVGTFVFRHGEHFYNFRGLRAYKEKFDPVWSPRYLASPGVLALPRILANVAALISGGLRGVLAK